MLLVASSVCGLFKWRQFEPEVILLAVGWYLRFSLGSAAYREPALLRERQKFLAFFERRREGLLRIDVLARFERHNIQLGVDGRQH